jgi:hypothetical protein
MEESTKKTSPIFKKSSKDVEEFKKELLIEKKAEAELYDEIKHISSNGYFDENDFGIEEDFDEINDKLFNKIKNILLNKTNGILETRIYTNILVLTEKEDEKEDEILIEKIIRISIVLLHDHQQQEHNKLNGEFYDMYYDYVDYNKYHDIIINICNLLLSNKDELKSNIKLFYKKTTGNELRLK